MGKESKNENSGPGSGEEMTEYLHAAAEISALRAMLSMKKKDECNSEEMRKRSDGKKE